MIRTNDYNRELRCCEVEVHGTVSDIIKEYSCIGQSVFRSIKEDEIIDDKTRVKVFNAG